MKTFIMDIIPKIKKFSKKLDDISILVGKHWVLIEPDNYVKVVYIFREKNNQLLISQDGIISKGFWENIGNNSLVIEIGDYSYLFKHGFVDDNVLALKIDGKNEYALFASEEKFESALNTYLSIQLFLEREYIISKGSPKSTTINKSFESKSEFYIKPTRDFYTKKHSPSSEEENHFNAYTVPNFLNDLKMLLAYLKKFSKINRAEIIIGFVKDRSIRKEYVNSNLELANAIMNGELPIIFLGQAFRKSADKPEYRKELEKFLYDELQ
jgi:hypothetical protein